MSIPRLITNLKLAKDDLPVFHHPAIEEVIAKLVEMEVDARRYRWFCAQEYPDDIADDATKWPDFKAALDERIDAAIDAASGERK